MTAVRRGHAAGGHMHVSTFDCWAAGPRATPRASACADRAALATRMREAAADHAMRMPQEQLV